MPLLDKKLLLADIEKSLGEIETVKNVQRIVEAVADALASYDVEALPSEDDRTEDENLLELFFSAKVVEGRSKGTIEQYRYTLEALKKELGVPFSKVTVHHLRTYLMREKERGVSLSTLEGKRYVYKSFFGWCWREELLEKDHTVNLKPIRQVKVIRKPFTEVEVEKLKTAAKTVRDRAIICFLLATGCRISEMCGLNRDSIDFQNKRVTVFGKGSKERRVYIDDIVIMYLHQYFKERADSMPALFVGKGSARLTPDGVRFMLGQLSKDTGIENVHPHRFRRTLASTLIAHGMAVQEVAAILGHEKLDTTMEYVYLNQQNIESSYRKYA